MNNFLNKNKIIIIRAFKHNSRSFSNKKLDLKESVNEINRISKEIQENAINEEISPAALLELKKLIDSIPAYEILIKRTTEIHKDISLRMMSGEVSAEIFMHLVLSEILLEVMYITVKELVEKKNQEIFKKENKDKN